MNETPTAVPTERPRTNYAAAQRELARIFVTIVVAAFVSITCVQNHLREVETKADRAVALARDDARYLNMLDKRVDALEVEVATPPTNDKLYTVTTKGVGQTEWEHNPNQVGTTPEAAFSTDLTTTEQTNAFTQMFVISNQDSTDNLCWKPIAWATAGATCTAKCAGATITCTGGGTSTDGSPLQPGQAVSRVLDGTSCVCVVGSAAGVDYDTERVVR